MSVSDSDVPKKRLEPTVYYAAERTLLAWVRTGLAMMSFGFVVARFGLFLQELAAASTSHHFRSTGFRCGSGRRSSFSACC